MKTLAPIAYAHTVFPDKFGVPRQSALCASLEATIVFEPPYRAPACVRGLEMYSHLWLIWGFSQNPEDAWSPVVRPPRLGGNKKIGVFATRSPFRPNGLGLSKVALVRIEQTNAHGAVLHVRGADMTDNTPIYDIKPYIPYTDAQPDARGGFAQREKDAHLNVLCDEALLQHVPQELRAGLTDILSQDPRPAYQHDETRVYGFPFAGFEIKFSVSGDTLRVLDIMAVKR